MADQPTDPELTFAALQAAAERIGPRQPVEDSGACGGCRLGATGSEVIQEILYWTCRFCGTRWKPVTPRHYAGEFIADALERLEVLEQQLTAMSCYDELDPIDPAHNPQPMMMQAPTGAEGAPTMHDETSNEDPRVLAHPLFDARHPLANRRLILADIEAREAAQRTPPTFQLESPEERAVWAARLSLMDRATRDRYESLAATFEGYAQYMFPIAGQTLPGHECARRLRLGDEFLKYFKAQNSGEARSRR